MTGARITNGKLRTRNGLIARIEAGAGTVGTLTLTDIDKDQRLFQRTAGNYYDVTVAGTSTGTNPVQARAVDSYTGAVAVDWTTVAMPSGGTFSGKLRCPARVNPCKLEIRDAGATSTVVSGANRFYVGAYWIFWGQSNSVAWPGGGDGSNKYPNGGRGAIEYVNGVFRRVGWIIDTYPPNSLHSSYATVNTYPGGSAVNLGGSKGDGWVYMANILSAELGCAVCLVNSSTGGQALSFWDVGATGWNNMLAALAEIGGDAEGSVLYQGEGDASGAATTKAGYKSQLVGKMAQFHNAIPGRTASNFKFGVVSLGSTNANGGYVTRMADVRSAQVEFANSTQGAFLLAANHDAMTTDGIHVNAISFSHLGAAGGRTLAALYGIGASGAGPRVTSATRSGAVITLNVQHAGGTALLDGGGGTGTALTGFRVTDGGAAATISATAITSPTTIQLALSAVPSGTVTVDYGMTAAPHSADGISSQTTPVYASAVYDNVPLVNQSRGCILQPFAAITVTGA